LARITGLTLITESRSGFFSGVRHIYITHSKLLNLNLKLMVISLSIATKRIKPLFVTG